MAGDGRYVKTTHGGKAVDRWTKQALQEMERRLGYDLTITQGSFNATVSQSGGTHDKGGVVDLAGYDADRKAKVGREVGFIAWKRTPDQGNWPTHVHMILRGHKALAPAAQRQVALWEQGFDGLVGNRPDYGSRDIPVFKYVDPRPGVWINRAIAARTYARRKECLRNVIQFGNKTQKARAQAWLDAIEAQQAASKTLREARASFEKLVKQ